ncbi:MAG: MATE family efflux transporter [Planctomycetales bacterium]|nr:MATE family efflux transporter [Planctomycetales bacterium]
MDSLLAPAGDLTRGPLGRQVAALGWPLAGAMILHALFNLVDLLFVGRIAGQGTEAIAAVHTAGVLNMVVMIVANGICVGALAIAARLCGEGKPGEAGRVGDQTLGILLGLAIAAGVPGVVLSRPLVALCGLSGLSADLAHTYNWIMMSGSGTMFLLLHTTTLMRAAGESVWPMVLLVLSNVLNLVLDYLMIFGWGPIPAMGVAGAAWATVISRGVGAVGGLLLLSRGVRGIRFHPSGMRPEPRMAGRILRIGLPQSAQIVIWILSVGVLNRVVTEVAEPGWGHVVVAAYGVGVRLDMLAFFGCAAWGGAAASFVGQNLGAKNPARAAAATWAAAGWAAVLAAAIGTTYLLIPHAVVRLFLVSETPGVVEEGVRYLHWVVPAYLFVALNVVLSQAMNGAGSTLTPLALDAGVRLGLQIPLAFWLPEVSGLRVAGVWATVLLANALLCALFVAVFLLGRWKHKRLD